MPGPGHLLASAIRSAFSVSAVSILLDMALTNHLTGIGIQYCRQEDKAGTDANVGDIGNPGLVQPANSHSPNQVRIDRELMVTVRSGNPLTIDTAEQITLPHQTQDFLVVDQLPLVFQLMGNPAVAIPGKLKAYSLNSVS